MAQHPVHDNRAGMADARWATLPDILAKHMGSDFELEGPLATVDVVVKAYHMDPQRYDG